MAYPKSQPQAPGLELRGSRLFALWLAGRGASLAFTTYHTGKMFLVGTRQDGFLSAFERSFSRPMGLGADPNAPGAFYLSSQSGVMHFENFLDPGDTYKGYDAVFVPIKTHTTGEIDIHDIQTRDGKVIFAATRFNCIATTSEEKSFRPIWKPAFMDRLVDEDCCHLIGLAMDERGARPAYATCAAGSNVGDGWRDQLVGGGLVLDIDSNEIVCSGLSIPNSPRLHDGKLWLLQSGTGEFGVIDPATGAFETVCFLPGYARGLAFVNNYAVIGLSRPRNGVAFDGLPLRERLERDGAEPQCGLAVVNLKTGHIEHRLLIDGVIDELCSVAVLPGVRRPMAVGVHTDEIA
ncbi:MAG: TIGR03032 family protein, partial [Pseudomonadota bacterium]